MTFQPQIDAIGLIVGIVSDGRPSVAPSFKPKDAQMGLIMSAGWPLER